MALRCRGPRPPGRPLAVPALGLRQPSSRSPGAMRMPRAQSAAGHRLPAGGPHLAELDRRRAGADEHRGLADVQLARRQHEGVAGGHHPGRAGRAVAARHADPHRPELEPLAAERRPRPGRRGAAAHVPVDDVGRQRPAHPRLLGAQLGREADALGRLRHRVQRAVGQGVHRRDEQTGAGVGQPVEQGARGVVGAHRLGERAEHRPGVEPLLEHEGRGAGDVVAGHDARAAPGRRRARPAAARSAG